MPARRTTTGDLDAEKRLTIAVELAAADFDRLRPGDRLNLKDDVRRFLWPSIDRKSTGGVWLTDVPTHKSITDKVLVGVRDGTRRLLADIVSDRDEQRIEKRDDGTGTPPQEPTHFENLRLRLVSDPDGSCYEELVGAETVEERFLYVLHRLLVQEGLGSKIRRCPECGKVFVRRRRQKNCSLRCTHTANKRAYRSAHRKRARERVEHRRSRPPSAAN